MSFSTCSAPSTSSGSDVKQDSRRVKKGWEDELKDRIQVFPGTVQEFIDTLLPCSTPFVATPEVLNAFWAYNTHQGDEVSSYPALLSGLERILSSFPTDKRISFAATSDNQIPFPFTSFKDHHHHTKPDLSASFPGMPIPLKPVWKHISTVIEVKGSAEEDPFPRGGERHVGTITQLAKNARNLMLAHGFLCSFVIGIYGNIVRLARFDHSCALVSPCIDLRLGGARVLQKFFWHFVHPIVGHPVVGNDPTISKLDKDSREWIRWQLMRRNPKVPEKHLSELKQGRRVEVYDNATGRAIPYLLYHVVDVNGRLFSRATMVWRAIEDTRVWKDGRLVPDPTRPEPVKPCILKEAWRQVVRPAETEYYHRLQDCIDEEERFGLAKMVYGGDIGELEMRWWQKTMERRAGILPDPTTNPTTPTSDSGAAIAAPPPADCPYPMFSSIGRQASSTSPTDTPGVVAEFPLHYPQHQTYSWRLLDAEYQHLERSHMRIVIDDVGRPLTQFTSTRELVEAIRDAIIGHRLAWEKAGVLHRDVSLGNILIVDEQVHPNAKFIGFLHDFDYSSSTADQHHNRPEDRTSSPNAISDGEVEKNKKERTGTYYFMAVELISGETIIHDVHHDLESFYWILLWVLLRHAECSRNGDSGEALCEKTFIWENDDLSMGAKNNWLQKTTTHKLVFPGNPPLTELMTAFTRQVASQTASQFLKSLGFPVSCLNYDLVLDLINQALADTAGWPPNDWKRCSLLDRDARTVPQDVVSLPPKPESSEPSLPSSPRLRPKKTVGRGLQSAPGQLPSRTQLASERPLDPRDLRPSKRRKTAMGPPPTIPAKSTNGSSCRRSGSRKCGSGHEPVRSSPRLAAKKASGSSIPPAE
ncbi:hypothetical protein C8Q77DRAFT_1156006 [Trametes polyzona]|nr:hypothetical protein C8Q77DRAFT_1156006 [Trametes polyzona]